MSKQGNTGDSWASKFFTWLTIGTVALVFILTEAGIEAGWNSQVFGLPFTFGVAVMVLGVIAILTVTALVMNAHGNIRRKPLPARARRSRT